MKKLLQFIKFVLVGVSNTLISEVIYVLLVFLGMHYTLATFIGFSISVLNAYYWGNRYVFKEQEGEERRIWWQVLLKTYIAYAGGLILDIVLLFTWIDVLHISQIMQPVVDLCHMVGITAVDAKLAGEIVAKAINVILIVPLNYIVNKYWAYRQRKKEC